jgi:hypothetical protein
MIFLNFLISREIIILISNHVNYGKKSMCGFEEGRQPFATTPVGKKGYDVK